MPSKSQMPPLSGSLTLCRLYPRPLSSPRHRLSWQCGKDTPTSKVGEELPQTFSFQSITKDVISFLKGGDRVELVLTAKVKILPTDAQQTM